MLVRQRTSTDLSRVQVPFQFEMPEPATTFLRQPTSLGEETLYELSLFFEQRESSD
jgi:hypothetical protein